MKKMTIYLRKLIGGKDIEVEVTDNVTIKELKEYITSVFPKLNKDEVSLLLDGEALVEMDATLGEYGVEHGSILELLPIGLIAGG